MGEVGLIKGYRTIERTVGIIPPVGSPELSLRQFFGGEDLKLSNFPVTDARRKCFLRERNIPARGARRTLCGVPCIEHLKHAHADQNRKQPEAQTWRFGLRFRRRCFWDFRVASFSHQSESTPYNAWWR